MTCDDYLAMLETLPIEDLMHGDAREHAAQCHDCNRVTRVVIERERSMIMAYGDLRPPASATTMAASAVRTARHRRVAFVSRMAVAIAAAGAIVVVVGSRLVVRPRVGLVSTSLPLRCLTPQQAIAVVRPVLSERASLSYNREGGQRLDISAPEAEVRAARSAVDAEVSAVCAVGFGAGLVAVPKQMPSRRR
jgi:hypothetical protein